MTIYWLIVVSDNIWNLNPVDRHIRNWMTGWGWLRHITGGMLVLGTSVWYCLRYYFSIIRWEWLEKCQVLRILKIGILRCSKWKNYNSNSVRIKLFDYLYFGIIITFIFLTLYWDLYYTLWFKSLQLKRKLQIVNLNQLFK